MRISLRIALGFAVASFAIGILNFAYFISYPQDAFNLAVAIFDLAVGTFLAILLWCERLMHLRAGKVLVSAVAIKTSSSPFETGREIARGYAPAENPLKPAGLCR